MYIPVEISFVSRVRIIFQAWGAKLAVEAAAAKYPTADAKFISYVPVLNSRHLSDAWQLAVSQMVSRPSPKLFAICNDSKKGSR